MRGSKAKLIPYREEMLDKEMRMYEIDVGGQTKNIGARKHYQNNKRLMKMIWKRGA